MAGLGGKGLISVVPQIILQYLSYLVHHYTCSLSCLCLILMLCCYLLEVMDDEDQGLITAGAVVTVTVELKRSTLKVHVWKTLNDRYSSGE